MRLHSVMRISCTFAQCISNYPNAHFSFPSTRPVSVTPEEFICWIDHYSSIITSEDSIYSSCYLGPVLSAEGALIKSSTTTTSGLLVAPPTLL